MSTTTPLFPTAPTSSDLFVNPRTATTTSGSSAPNNTAGGYGWGGGGYGTGQSAYFQTVVISLVALAVLLIISVASPPFNHRLAVRDPDTSPAHRCSSITVAEDYDIIKVKNGRSPRCLPMDVPGEDDAKRIKISARRPRCTNVCLTSRLALRKIQGTSGAEDRLERMLWANMLSKTLLNGNPSPSNHSIRKPSPQERRLKTHRTAHQGQIRADR